MQRSRRVRTAAGPEFMSNHRLTVTSLALLLAVATALCYLPAYQAGFVNLDDGEYVQKNEHVNHGLRAGDVQWAFTSSHSANWHPLTWISHMADVQLFGLDARGHHAVNVALHAVNVVLLFLLLTWMTGQTAPSFVVAALFALHPVNVESVAWISQRKTTLSTLFGILAIWSYAWYARAGGGKAYLLSLALFALSLMSKQMLVTLPFALLLLDYWPLERAQLDPGKGRLPTLCTLLQGWWRLFPEKVPYLALAVASSLVTLIVQQKAMKSVESYPVLIRMGNVILAYVSYLAALVWPARLAAFYPLRVEGITAAKVLMSLVLLTALSVLCFWLGRRWRYLLVGWLWYLGTMVPVIGVVQVGTQSMADRYAYVPFWGFFIAIAWSGYDLLTAARAKAPSTFTPLAAATGVSLALLLGGFGWRTFLQAEHWHDTTTLFEAAAADTAPNWLAHQILAREYYNAGNYQRALEQSEAAANANAEAIEVLNTRGLALYGTGAVDEAIQSLEKAQQVAPREAISFTNLGWLYVQQGKFDLASEQFAQAAERLTGGEPLETQRTAYVNWATTLRQLHRPAEALEKYEQALAIDPYCALVLTDAAETELSLDHADRAIERLELASKLDPHDSRAAYLLGKAWQAQGKLDRAAASFAQAATLDPRNYDAAVQEALLAARLGDLSEGVRKLQAVLKSVHAATPSEATRRVCSTIQAHLGDLAFAQRQPAAALEHYNQALADWPDNYIANNNLAWLLATSHDGSLRDGKRAAQLAEHACQLLKEPTPSALSTLAVAQAMKGDMAAAIETARQGRELADKEHDSRMVSDFDHKLRLFREGKPFVEGP